MKKIAKSIENSPLKLIAISLFISVFALSCSDDDENPVAIDEEEVITTMKITLSAAESTITIQSQDLDGDGPDEPVITISDDLLANTSYAGSIQLLNETETPSEDITLEVQEEDDEHQFFFAVDGAISDVSYNDEDDNGNPVGIEFTLNTGDAGSGTLQVTLRHQPTKPNDGTLADAGGDTDIAQSFTLVVQ